VITKRGRTSGTASRSVAVVKDADEHWADYPAEAAAMDARDGEAGIDYAIGDPASAGRGAGTKLIAALVAEVRRQHHGAGMLVGPDAADTASRRVLEKNGFETVPVRPVATEPGDTPMAIYRLPSRPRHE
jgi:GNAT superfamily N-acetyltransferase